MTSSRDLFSKAESSVGSWISAGVPSALSLMASKNWGSMFSWSVMCVCMWWTNTSYIGFRLYSTLNENWILGRINSNFNANGCIKRATTNCYSHFNNKAVVRTKLIKTPVEDIACDVNFTSLVPVLNILLTKCMGINLLVFWRSTDWSMLHLYWSF